MTTPPVPQSGAAEPLPEGSDRRPRASTGGAPSLGGTGVVAAGMMVQNVTVYGFSVAGARLLVPEQLGAVTALLGILLMGNVLSLGLQATTARRLAVSPEDRDQVVVVVRGVMLAAGGAAALLVAATSVVLDPVLKLGSPWPLVLCGLTLIPLTVMGAQAGIAQGTGRWRLLSGIYAANGLGRLVLGGLALVVVPDATSAMAGVALGACIPVLVGLPLLRASVDRRPPRRAFATEAFHGTHALLAYFVLCSLDALIARERFGVRESGLYAAGVILAKAALFLPQFVSVVLYPAIARDHTPAAARKALAMVVACGALAVGATALLPDLALILVGGDAYRDVAGRLWLFALAGSCLAVVNLLVLGALARQRRGIVPLVWTAVAALVALAYGLDVHITGLVTSLAAVSACLAVAVWVVTSRTPGSADGVDPAQ